MAELEEIDLGLDELEAMRLVDLDGLYHAEAAERMGVSRPTLTRMIDSARHKVADALVSGKAITVKGGNVVVGDMRGFQCAGCGHHWELAHDVRRPDSCPNCGSRGIKRWGDRPVDARKRQGAPSAKADTPR
jgi:predicted DNA-binding protein (UPF0251 family)